MDEDFEHDISLFSDEEVDVDDYGHDAPFNFNKNKDKSAIRRSSSS